MCKGASFPDWLLSNCFYFLCERLYARKGGRSHVCMRCTRLIKRREVIERSYWQCIYKLLSLENIISKSDHFPKFTPVMVVSLGEQALWGHWGALSGRGQVCLCSSPPESTLKGQVMVASRLSKSVISHVIGYHPPLTHSEIKFIVASEIYRERNSRINMSLQTIGIS